MNRTAFAVLALSTLAVVTAGAQDLKEAEKRYLIEKLQNSRRDLIAAVESLTDEQWKWKSSPDRWSVAEVAEHITLTEPFLFGYVQKIMTQPAQPERASQLKPDAERYSMMTDRTNKATAPEQAKPTGRFGNRAELMKQFQAARDKTIAFAETTPGLRTHFTQFGPMGTMDAYQMLLTIAAHNDRHLAQIKEVIAQPNFPKR